MRVEGVRLQAAALSYGGYGCSVSCELSIIFSAAATPVEGKSTEISVSSTVLCATTRRKTKKRKHCLL